MIAVQLGGGVGNQLFQYATARALALRLGVPLVLDRRLFEGHRSRRFALDAFAIEAAAADDRALPAGGDILANLSSWLRPRSRFTAFRERTFRFDPAIMTLPDWTWLRGNFQSELYFADQEAALRGELAFRQPLDPENSAVHQEIAGTLAISVHVRRGDYVSNPRANRVHGIVEPDFYRRAAKHVAERCGGEPAFFVFTDDPGWVSAEFDMGFPFRLVVNGGEGRETQDLSLMAACRHHIVANSSFSWWGAWLNASPEAIVVAPRLWFRDPTMDDSTLVPERWVRL